MDKSIELDQTLSGTNEAPFIIRAAEGEKVVLSAGILLQKLNWKEGSNGIWSVNIPAGTVMEDLYGDGKKLIKARYPNFNPKILPFNGYAADAISEERVNKWKNPEGGYVHVLHEGKWGGFHFMIKGNDKDGNLIWKAGNRIIDLVRCIMYFDLLKIYLKSWTMSMNGILMRKHPLFIISLKLEIIPIH